MDQDDGPVPTELPPPPGSTPARQVPYPNRDNPDVRGLKRIVVIVGIIGGFLLYIVPGFFGLRSYHRWQRGETRTPLGWTAVGWLWVAIIVLLVVLTLEGKTCLGDPSTY